jgi:hypothetical protein
MACLPFTATRRGADCESVGKIATMARPMPMTATSAPIVVRPGIEKEFVFIRVLFIDARTSLIISATRWSCSSESAGGKQTDACFWLFHASEADRSNCLLQARDRFLG